MYKSFDEGVLCCSPRSFFILYDGLFRFEDICILYVGAIPMAGREFNRFICWHGVDHAHGPYLLFSEELAQCSRFTAVVAGADVGFIFQHDLYVGVGHHKLWYCYEAPYNELVDNRNCGTSATDGEIRSFRGHCGSSQGDVC